MSIITRLFGTKEERQGAREAKHRAREQAINSKLALHLRELREESYKLSADLVRRYMTRQMGSGADLSAIKAIANALQGVGRPAVGPLCTLIEEECYRDERLIYAAEEAISVLAKLGDKKAIPAIVRGASLLSILRDSARKALLTLGGQAAVDLLEQQIAFKK